MSQLMSQARTRLPRLAEAASLRERLALVPARPSTARRTPFVVLIFGVLAAGVVGLLMFNTHMQQGAFFASDLQRQADSLTAQQQGLDMELQQLRDPQRLAVAGRALGMVAPVSPAFVKLSDGKIVGDPTVAQAAQDRIRVQPYPVAVPGDLVLAPRIVKVQPVTKAPAKTTAKKSSGAGAASTAPTTHRGTKKTTR